MQVGRSLGMVLVMGALVLGSAAGHIDGRAAAQGTSPGPAGAPRGKAPAAPHVHATPKGWRFTWPKGDATRGREVFQKLECFTCHEVRGERFPAPSDAGRAGPELSMMGPLHPPEFVAESIINPSAVIEGGRGYAAADGSSKMPSYGDSLTVQEAIDLVAYLRQLRPPAGASPGAGGQGGHPGHTSP
jgi:mono/diheme cytochrome c family protein